MCSVSLHSCCPAPSRCHGRESCTPAKLQCNADGSQKHQASKQNLPNSNDSRTDKTLNRASDKHSCRGVGGGKWDHFVHSLFTAEQRDGTSFSQVRELSEVKNEPAGNRIRGQMNGFPLTWDMLMALTLGKHLFHLSLAFHQKHGKITANAAEMLSKINSKFGHREYWIHLVLTCFQSLFYQQAWIWTLFYCPSGQGVLHDQAQFSAVWHKHRLW